MPFLKVSLEELNFSQSEEDKQALENEIEKRKKMIHLLLKHGGNFSTCKTKILDYVMPDIQEYLNLNPLFPHSLQTICLRKINEHIRDDKNSVSLPLPKSMRLLLKGQTTDEPDVE